MKTSTKTLLIATAIAGGIAAAGVNAAPPWGGAGCGYGPGAMGAGPQGMGFGGPGMGYGPHRMDPEARIERMADMLDLTKEQRDKVRAIVDKSRPQTRELRDKMADNRNQLRTLAQQGSPKEADVRKLADTQGKLMADMIVQRTKVRTEIHAVLTPEQREKLQQRFEQRGRWWGADAGDAADGVSGV
jgi:Spy/CpxP family protein refolding chaperone